jgi:hypothetical protein
MSTSLESSVGRQPTRPTIEEIVVPPNRPSYKGNKEAGRSGVGGHENGSTGILPFPDRPF